MWALVFLNVVGLLAEMGNNFIIMYVVYGISFVAFFHSYAVISWKLIYEGRVEEIGRMDAKVANEFVCAFAMVCIFWLMVQKLGIWSSIVPIIQCIIFHVIKLIQNRDTQDIWIMISYILELLLGGAMCFV